MGDPYRDRDRTARGGTGSDGGGACGPGCAAASGAPFARAIHKIDETAQADAIEARLLALETEALEKRSALATGFAFPVTIDVLKAWTDRLYGKGFILAPASAVIETPAKPTQVKSTKVTGLATPPTTTGDPAP